jgi:hypothetical protein
MGRIPGLGLLSSVKWCARLARKHPASAHNKGFLGERYTFKACRQEKESSRGGVRNGETLIRLQERIRASRGLPVSGGSQVDESIEIIKLYCQVFFQVVGHRRRSWWGSRSDEAPIPPLIRTGASSLRPVRGCSLAGKSLSVTK